MLSVTYQEGSVRTRLHIVTCYNKPYFLFPEIYPLTSYHRRKDFWDNILPSERLTLSKKPAKVAKADVINQLDPGHIQHRLVLFSAVDNLTTQKPLANWAEKTFKHYAHPASFETFRLHQVQAYRFDQGVYLAASGVLNIFFSIKDWQSFMKSQLAGEYLKIGNEYFLSIPALGIIETRQPAVANQIDTLRIDLFNSLIPETSSDDYYTKREACKVLHWTGGKFKYYLNSAVRARFSYRKQEMYISQRGIDYLQWADFTSKRFRKSYHLNKQRIQALTAQKSELIQNKMQEFPAIRDNKLQGQVKQLQAEVAELRQQVKVLSRQNNNPYSQRLRRKLY